MKQRINRYLKRFDKEIDDLECDEEDILIKAERGILISKRVLKSLREIIISSGFKSEKDEIQFFKTSKPKVYSKLIYYVKLFNRESKRPRGSSIKQRKYLDSEIVKLQDYFNDNLEFYQYY